MRNSKNALLVITAALLAGTGFAGAQGMNSGATRGEGASSAPASEQQAPAEKAAPHRGATGHERSGATERKSESAAPGGRSETTGQAPQRGETPKASPESGSRSEPAPKASGSTKSGTETQSNEPKSGSERSEGKSSTPSTTTGQGAAGTRSAVSLSTEQRTKIRTVIKEKVHAQPLTKVNFNISVGTKVPRTVHYYPLPTEVVEIHPAWRGFDFILVGDQIVVIDPGTFEIVAVIEA